MTTAQVIALLMPAIVFGYAGLMWLVVRRQKPGQSHHEQHPRPAQR
jgi:hypothetical protein